MKTRRNNSQRILFETKQTTRRLKENSDIYNVSRNSTTLLQKEKIKQNSTSLFIRNNKLIRILNLTLPPFADMTK